MISRDLPRSQVKTDQRSRALELLCLGVFARDAAMYPLVVVDGVGGKSWPLKKGFEKNFGVDTWHPKPTNARMIWQVRHLVRRPFVSPPLALLAACLQLA